MSWCTIESDPGVFTSLIEDIGVQGVQVEELYSLDPTQFTDLAPVYGLVFLFKYESTHHSTERDRPTLSHDEEAAAGLFFAKQVITNACATQAILSILLNARNIALGTTLRDFKAFTGDFPSDLKGLAISNSEQIRRTHNSFARPEPFEIEERKATSDDDVYHFIAYVPVNGKVYELDGLRDGPICLGAVSASATDANDDNDDDDAWLRVACPVIQQRIEQYAASEIRFNLLALIRNRIDVLSERIAALDAVGDAAGVAELQRAVADERQKRTDWAIENARRKHNYLPFIVQLLKTLAAKQQLQPLIQQQQAAATATASNTGPSTATPQ